MAQSAKISYPRLGPPWPARKQPSWINQGLVFSGTWEPLPWLYRKNWQDWGSARAGAQAEALYREERTEATVLGLKKLGVNMILTSFHKGFGIENERTTMREAAQLAALLHKHGMKMGVYVSGLLIYEDLYAEFPEAKNWHRMKFDGSPDTYGDDGFRYRAFLNHPEYLNYMKRVCELAIKAGADLIHFDVISQPFGNFHPMAEAMFREWLKKKYPTREGWFFRTGLQNRDFVKIPYYPDPGGFQAFDQPIMQEYLRFAAGLVGEYAAEMCTFIHRLNPECAIEFNPQGITGANRVLQQHIDHPTILKWLDAYWSEGPNNIGYTGDGRMISRIRSYKLAQQYNSLLFAYTGDLAPSGDRSVQRHRDPRLPLAEAMAFNRQCLGDVGSPLVYKDFPAEGRRYLDYFWKRFDLFARGETASEIAVLRSFASMAYNNYATHRETMLAEQALIQHQAPFDIIADEDLARLSKYKVVVLAGQECLSDEQIEKLRAFVRGGGGVVATADTARYNEWRRDRGVAGLGALAGSGAASAQAREGPGRQALGAGRVAYLAALRPAIPVPARAAFLTTYWAAPKNSKELLEAIGWASGGKLSLEVSAPASVAAEFYHQPGKNRHVLHLVNFGAGEEARPVGAEFLWRGARPAKITLWSPDQPAPANLESVRSSDGIRVKVPNIGVYSIVTLERAPN